MRWGRGEKLIPLLRKSAHEWGTHLHLASSKGEGKCLHSGVKKLDYKGVVGDWPLQTHELIEAVIGDDAIALGVGVHSMTFSRSLAVDGDAKANRFAASRWSEHKMQIAGMKTERDLAARRVQYGELFAIDPTAGERPLVQAKR